MSAILEAPKVSKHQSTNEKKEGVFFQVFLGFKKPDGKISVAGTCNVYEHLGQIFTKNPHEIKQSIYAFVYRNGDGYMQEYLSLDDASIAVAQASLFAHTTQCTCFFKQEAYFYIKELKK